MKLNFWQWLAVVLLIIGAVWWVYDWSHARKNALPTGSPPTTQGEVRAP